MAGGIGRRIKSLEAAHGREPCEECGWAGDWSNVDHVVTWGDPDPDDSGPEWCGTCGHQLVYVVTWGDIPDPKGAS